MDTVCNTGSESRRRLTASSVFDPPKKLVISGQSNAAKWVPAPVPIFSNLPNQNLLHNGNPVTPTNVPVEAMGSRWGIELPIADQINTGVWDLIKQTEASSEIALHVPGSANHSALLSKLSGCPPDSEICFLWIHGESDAGRERTATADYESDWTSIVDSLTAAFPNIQIYDVLLNPIQSGSAAFPNTPADIARINTAKQNVAAVKGNVTTFGNNYNFQADGIHYDASGIISMANDFLSVSSK